MRGSHVVHVTEESGILPGSYRLVFSVTNEEGTRRPQVALVRGSSHSIPSSTLPRAAVTDVSGWADDVPRSQVIIEPASVREIRVVGSSLICELLYAPAARLDEGAPSRFLKLVIKRADVPGNPPEPDFRDLARNVAIMFLQFWETAATSPATAASAGGARSPVISGAAAPHDALPPPSDVDLSGIPAGEHGDSASDGGHGDGPSAHRHSRLSRKNGGDEVDEEDEDDEDGDDEGDEFDEKDLAAALQQATLGGVHPAVASGAAGPGSVLTAGGKSSSARSLKLKEVQEAALGISRILSNVNLNKEARSGLSRRAFRRKLLQDQLATLATSITTGGGSAGGEGSEGASAVGGGQAGFNPSAFRAPAARQAYGHHGGHARSGAYSGNGGYSRGGVYPGGGGPGGYPGYGVAIDPYTGSHVPYQSPHAAAFGAMYAAQAAAAMAAGYGQQIAAGPPGGPYGGPATYGGGYRGMGVPGVRGSTAAGPGSGGFAVQRGSAHNDA